MALNEDIKKVLKDKLSYTSQDISNIENSPYLIELLNIFYKSHGNDPEKLSKALILDIDGTNAGYTSDSNVLKLGGKYNNLGFLAHELTHAAQEVNRQGMSEAKDFLKTVYISEYDSMDDYANAKCLVEGEAFFYEFKVLESLGQTLGTTEVWEDESLQKTGKDLTDIVKKDIGNAEFPTKDIIQKLGDLYTTIIPSTTGGILTYSEKAKWDFAQYKPSISKGSYGNVVKDYSEVMDKSLSKNEKQIKILLNKENDFYGESGNDKIINPFSTGSLLGQVLGEPDLLYGGNGNDTLYGGEGNDTLEDTSGNNILY